MAFSAAAAFDSSYLRIQATIADLAGWADAFKFVSHVGPDSDVLDFGCGGGFLLAGLPTTGRKHGVEVNFYGRELADRQGIKSFATTAATPGGYDVIISNHGLERCENPLGEIRALTEKLREGGRMVFYVPAETWHTRWTGDDSEHHLHTWSPMCLANLFTAAGLRVIDAGPLHHRWPPNHRFAARVLGRRGFHLAALAWGWLWRNHRTQAYVVGVRD